MGGWMLVYEDDAIEIWECAMCSNPEHTITRDKKTGEQTWGKHNENYGM